MIKILIVDDHKILRDGIKALLSSDKNIEVAGECEEGHEVIPFLENNIADIILMDIKMKHSSGISTTKEVLKKYPDMKIIALSMHNEEIYISKMLEAGASGYVLKNAGEGELIQSIMTVHGGDIFFSPEVTDIMMSKYMNKTRIVDEKAKRRYIKDLTRREMDILKLIIDEKTNVEMGKILFISPRTVDTHRRNILRKLGVKNTAGLVKLTLQYELIDQEIA